MNGSSDEPATTRFPIPLVGTACLLAVLIVLTPVLVTGGAAGGTLVTQAELYVDHPSTTANTSFLVSALGNVRYAAIDIGLNLSYPAGGAASDLVWGHWTNQTDTIGAYVVTSSPHVAVNITVAYREGNGDLVRYFGIVGVAYDLAAGTIQLYALSPGISVPSGPIPTSSAMLPVLIPLDYLGTGGLPT